MNSRIKYSIMTNNNMINNNTGINYGAVDDRTDSANANSKVPALVASKAEEHPSPAGEHQHHSVTGILFITLGAFSFSVMYLIVKLMAETSTFTLVLYRSIVQIVLSSLSLWKSGHNLLGDPNDRFWLAIRGTFGAGAVCAWFFGIQHLPLPDAVTLQFTTPPFAATFGVFILGEPYLPLDVVGAIVCLSGVALIAHPTWLFGSNSEASRGNDDNVVDDGSNSNTAMMKTLAILITELGAAMAGIAYVSVRRIHRDCPATTMVLYYGVASLPLCFFGSRYFEGTWNAWRISDFEGRDYILLLLMGLGGYGGQWFTNLGLQRETAATATLATTTQIVWTYIFELLILHELLNWWSIMGTILILSYMLLVAILKITNATSTSSALPDASEDENKDSRNEDL